MAYAERRFLTQNLDAGDEGWRAHPCAAKGFRGGCTEKCWIRTRRRIARLDERKAAISTSA